MSTIIFQQYCKGSSMIMPSKPVFTTPYLPTIDKFPPFLSQKYSKIFRISTHFLPVYVLLFPTCDISNESLKSDLSNGIICFYNLLANNTPYSIQRETLYMDMIGSKNYYPITAHDIAIGQLRSILHLATASLPVWKYLMFIMPTKSPKFTTAKGWRRNKRKNVFYGTTYRKDAGLEVCTSIYGE